MQSTVNFYPQKRGGKKKTWEYGLSNGRLLPVISCPCHSSAPYLVAKGTLESMGSRWVHSAKFGRPSVVTETTPKHLHNLQEVRYLEKLLIN